MHICWGNTPFKNTVRKIGYQLILHTDILINTHVLPISDGPSIFCLSGDKVDLCKSICLLLLANIYSFTLLYATGTSHIVAEIVRTVMTALHTEYNEPYG